MRLTHLTFCDKVQPLDQHPGPHLTFGTQYNQSVDALDLKNVTHLTFGTQFNQSVDALDLKNVTHLTFGYQFNQSVDALDLKNVRQLTFGHRFNQRIDALDLKDVTDLTLGGWFNGPVNQINLKNVRHLTFGWWFNWPLDGLNLKGVTDLVFGQCFNRPLNKLNLGGVTNITFGHLFKEHRDRVEWLLGLGFERVGPKTYRKTSCHSYRSFYFVQHYRFPTRTPYPSVSISLVTLVKSEFGSDNRRLQCQEGRLRIPQVPGAIWLPPVESIQNRVVRAYNRLVSLSLSLSSETVIQIASDTGIDATTVRLQLVNHLGLHVTRECHVCMEPNGNPATMQCCKQDVCLPCLIRIKTKTCCYCRSSPLIFSISNGNVTYSLDYRNAIRIVQ